MVVIFGRDLWILGLSAYALKFTQFRDLAPSVWGKASTFLQIMTAVPVMAAEGYRDAVLRRICDGLILLVAAFAIFTAADYTWRGIRWLREKA